MKATLRYWLHANRFIVVPTYYIHYVEFQPQCCSLHPFLRITPYGILRSVAKRIIEVDGIVVLSLPDPIKLGQYYRQDKIASSKSIGF